MPPPVSYLTHPPCPYTPLFRSWPTKSRTVQMLLFASRRSPRPSCCRRTVGLSVGRSKSKVSTDGTSTPSLKRSTEKTTRISPAASACRARSEEPTSELQSLMRSSYAVFCLQNENQQIDTN